MGMTQYKTARVVINEDEKNNHHCPTPRADGRLPAGSGAYRAEPSLHGSAPVPLRRAHRYAPARRGTEQRGPRDHPA